MTARVVFWWDGDAYRLGVLARETKLNAFIVYLDEGRGVIVRRVAKLGLKVREAMHKGKPYPLTRARRHYRRIAKTWGMTKGAQAALKEAT